MIQSSFRTYLFYQSDRAEQMFKQAIEYFNQVDDLDCSTMSETRVSMTSSQPVLFKLTLSIDEPERHLFSYGAAVLSLRISADSLIRDGGAQRLDRYIGVLKQLYSETRPQYVCGMESELMEAIDIEIPSPVTDESLANNRINLPTWLMMFPPAMVEEYGREWLLNLPAERIEELDDGGIMVITTDEFADIETGTELTVHVQDAKEPLEAAFRDHE